MGLLSKVMVQLVESAFGCFWIRGGEAVHGVMVGMGRVVERGVGDGGRLGRSGWVLRVSFVFEEACVEVAEGRVEVNQVANEGGGWLS